jgi:hypothetical protein
MCGISGSRFIGHAVGVWEGSLRLERQEKSRGLHPGFFY